MNERRDFDPDWVSPPGATISAILSRKGVTHSALAKTLQLGESAYWELIHGDVAIDADLAARIAAVVGSTAKFWLGRSKQYMDSLPIAAYKLQREVKFPLVDMRKLGWIPKTAASEYDSATAAAKFMGVRSLNEFEEKYGSLEEALAYRRSSTFDMEIGAVAAWYRAAEVQVDAESLCVWDSVGFRECLKEARGYSLLRDPGEFVPKLRSLFRGCGVALCIAQAPPGCPVSGAARMLDGRGMIALSSRHLVDDHFWFSLFHEAGHLLLHGDRISIEVDQASGVGPAEEEEANQFALDLLIPEAQRDEVNRVPLTKFAIARVARAIGIAPGIVVGQLQYSRRLRFNQMNLLKTRYRWTGSTLGRV